MRAEGAGRVGRRARVLVAEDEWFLATEIAEALGAAGMAVVGPVSTASEALDAIRTSAADGGIDAAVLDVGLRDGSVARVASALRRIGVPFLYATGYPPEALRDLVPAPIVPKPSDGRLLARMLEALVPDRDAPRRSRFAEGSPPTRDAARSDPEG